jgi:nicotinate dehydrogenase subunit B
MSKAIISRRSLLKSGGALIVSFGLWDWAVAQTGPPVDISQFFGDPYNNPDYLDPTYLDSWLAITADGKVTIFTGKVELGNGVETALQQICAEELDVPFHTVHMAMGDTTNKTVDQGRTAGSSTIMRAGKQLRQATAAGRQELLKLASAHLQTPVERLTVADGVVSVSGDPAKKVSYGELVGNKRFDVRITATGKQVAMVVAPEVKPKSYKDYKIVGKPISRVDLPPKFTGEFTYTADVRVPGMLHGRVVRPPVPVSKPLSVDEASVSHIPGVVKVVTEGSFVGVVAETEWAAIQAAKALKVSWSQSTAKMWSSHQEVETFLVSKKSVRDLSPLGPNEANKGDVDAALAKASRTFEATYHWPFQLHGMMGPSCAIADVRGDKVTVWAGSQGPFTTRDRIAIMLKIPKRNIDVRWVESAGCWGRLAADDAPEDAVLMSRAVGKPVRVQWSREDENGWEPKGPPQVPTLRAGVDADGKITAWDFRDYAPALTESQGMPQLAERQVGIQPIYDGVLLGPTCGGEMYDFENRRVQTSAIAWSQPEADPLRTNHIRAPGEPPRVFASEGFLDEIASALNVDPVQYRLRYLKGRKRLSEVLVAAAEKAGWKERPSPAPAASGAKAVGRGIALATSRNSYFAAVAEVEVDTSTGAVKVNRITLAQDCGLIINPDGLRMQLEGNIIQGMSRALMEELKFDGSGIKSLDWANYPVIRFRHLPETEIVLLNRPEEETGSTAEPAVIVIPAAIANAVFDATGARLRQVPLTPERVLNALRAKGALTQRI